MDSFRANRARKIGFSNMVPHKTKYIDGGRWKFKAFYCNRRAGLRPAAQVGWSTFLMPNGWRFVFRHKSPLGLRARERIKVN